MQKGAIIGKGMTAEVYEWGQDKVLKLYFDWYPEDWVKYEAQIGSLVHTAGVSSPAVYEMQEVDGRKGIIFQRITGRTLFELIESKPWKLVYFAREMARLHAKMHSCIADKLPSQKERIISAVKESSDLFGDNEKTIIDYLDSLPDGKSICHGDFHPDNIIANGKELVIIDWTNAYIGNPFGDVARTCLMIRSPFLPPEAFKLMVTLSRVIKRLIYSAYLKEYTKLTKSTFKSIDEWILPIAAARFREKIPGEEKWLINIINKHLEHLGRSI